MIAKQLYDVSKKGSIIVNDGNQFDSITLQHMTARKPILSSCIFCIIVLIGAGSALVMAILYSGIFFRVQYLIAFSFLVPLQGVLHPRQ